MGSNPTARSFFMVYGVVAKWQGKGLQNPDHGFKSRRRLSQLLQWAAVLFYCSWLVEEKYYYPKEASPSGIFTISIS